MNWCIKKYWRLITYLCFCSHTFKEPSEVSLEVGGQKQENESLFDKSDILALRSVDEEEEEVGGISKIQMFSSTEEKFLEYTSLQVEH